MGPLRSTEAPATVSLSTSVTVPVIRPAPGLGALTSSAAKGAAIAIAAKINTQICRVLTTKDPSGPIWGLTLFHIATSNTPQSFRISHNQLGNWFVIYDPGPNTPR